jgi:hypothetical protein
MNPFIDKRHFMRRSGSDRRSTANTDGIRSDRRQVYDRRRPSYVIELPPDIRLQTVADIE